MGKLAFAIFFLTLLISSSFCYRIKQSRDVLLDRYYSYVEPKIPKSIKAIVGDERINVYIGESVVGIETKRGELYRLELSPIKNPTIVITVTSEAAEKIEKRKMGILEALENGGIKIKTYRWVSALKVEAIKKAYALSGIEKRLLNKDIKESEIYSTNSFFVRPRQPF